MIVLEMKIDITGNNINEKILYTGKHLKDSIAWAEAYANKRWKTIRYRHSEEGKYLFNPITGDCLVFEQT